MQDKKEAGIFELTLRSIRLPAAVACRSTRMPVEKDFPLFEGKRSKAAKKWPEATFFVIRASGVLCRTLCPMGGKKTAKGQPHDWILPLCRSSSQSQNSSSGDVLSLQYPKSAFEMPKQLPLGQAPLTTIVLFKEPAKARNTPAHPTRC